MRLERLSPAFDDAYRSFVASQRSALIYSSPDYFQFLKSVVPGDFGCLLALEGDRILGALPTFTHHVAGLGTIINSLPWYGSHGGCLLAGADMADVRTLLLSAYGELISQDDLLSATIVLSHAEQMHADSYRQALPVWTEDRRVGQVTELPQLSANIAEDLLVTFRQKTRNLVRKSLKQGFDLVIDDSLSAWEFLFATHEDNMSALNGRPKPWSHFQALRETIPAASRQLMLAYDSGQPVAAMLLLLFNETVEYFTPVIRHEFRDRQPLSFLIFHGMHQAVTAGYRRWNWGGTWVGQSSLHHFKQGWGAVDLHYSYLITATPDSIHRIESARHQLAQAFPYYYVYPYDQLDRCAAG